MTCCVVNFTARFFNLIIFSYKIGAPQVRTSFDVSLKNLQTDYLDSLVLHSPLPTEKENLQVWRAMEDFHQQVPPPPWRQPRGK